jgi:hypothetical protein
MKAQIRAKSRNRGATGPFFAVRMKNKGAGGPRRAQAVADARRHQGILIRTLLFRGDAWDVKVLPSGFIEGVPSCITVWVILQGGELSVSGVDVSIEILDNTWERTVFHDEHAGGGHALLTVTRTELELTSCVRNDFIPMRCTLTWIDTKKQEKTEGGSKWWCQLIRSLSQILAPLNISNSKSNLSEEASMVITADVIPDRPSTIHHLITIPG